MNEINLFYLQLSFLFRSSEVKFLVDYKDVIDRHKSNSQITDFFKNSPDAKQTPKTKLYWDLSRFLLPSSSSTLSPIPAQVRIRSSQSNSSKLRFATRSPRTYNKVLSISISFLQSLLKLRINAYRKFFKENLYKFLFYLRYVRV